MVKIGIDLGTTNSLVTIWKEGTSVYIPNSFSEYLTPSIVSIGENDEIYVGKIAKERLISHPKLTAASFKCFMGTNKIFRLGKRKFSPTDLSSFIIRQLKEDAEQYLKETVDEAIISVPAYFNDFQRQAVKDAGELAGIKVERIINEPSAAALAYCADKDNDQMFLVFDLGGGTLDISVVDAFDNVIEIVVVAGDNHLGGDDFDRIIAEYFCEQNTLTFDNLPMSKQKILLKKAEETKKQLNTVTSYEMVFENGKESYTCLFDEKILMEISKDIFQKIATLINKAMHDARIDFTNLDEVILVGGSSKMKIIRKFIQYITKIKPRMDVEPDYAIAYGVGVVAGIKERNADIKDTVLTDICPFSLGIAIINKHNNNKGKIFSPIIERNTTLPSSKIKEYTTAEHMQNYIRVEVFQGEAMYCNENEFLGDLIVSVPVAPAGVEGISVRFTYDINGILEVDAMSNTLKKNVNKVIIDSKIKMTEEEIQKRRMELATLKMHPKEKNENQLLISKAERLYEETFGIARDSIANMLQQFEMILESQNEWDIVRARRKLLFMLNNIEKSLHINAGFDIEEIVKEFESQDDDDYKELN